MKTACWRRPTTAPSTANPGQEDADARREWATPVTQPKTATATNGRTIVDNCPEARSNPDQTDTDGDGVGDVCDNCPAVDINPGQEDSSRKMAAGDVCNDEDQDGLPDTVETNTGIFVDETRHRHRPLLDPDTDRDEL